MSIEPTYRTDRDFRAYKLTDAADDLARDIDPILAGGAVEDMRERFKTLVEMATLIRLEQIHDDLDSIVSTLQHLETRS